MTDKPQVAIGIIGTVLDSGRGPRRWDKWRPTVSLGQHEDLLLHRIELLFQPEFRAIAQTVQEDLHAVSPETEVVLHELDLSDPWDFEEVWGALYTWARGTRFDTEREDYLLHITTGTHVSQICMYLLAESRHIPAKIIQTSPVTRRQRREGAEDLAGRYAIIDLDLSRYDAIAARFAEERSEGIHFLKAGIETRNAAFNRLMERMEQVALASTAPLLLTGPTGAGKTRLARRIYELKKQRRQVKGRFVEVNCATLRGDAAMSALFGHKRGAFTGAVSDRDGLLKAADKGLVFLDEIGELGLDEQAMLLRAIEAKVFVPMGSDRELSSDFQLIAGSNRDLVDAVREGRFRDDLLARINLWTFRLPGLAERIEDLEPNLDFELEQFAQQQGRKVSFSREARRAWLGFARGPEGTWAGNFRDLNASVTRMATLAPGGRICTEDVEEELVRLRSDWRGANRAEAPGNHELLIQHLGAERADELDRFDAVQLADVIAVCARSRSLSAAGRALFARSLAKRTSRNDADRLRKYLARFALRFEDLSP